MLTDPSMNRPAEWSTANSALVQGNVVLSKLPCFFFFFSFSACAVRWTQASGLFVVRCLLFDVRGSCFVVRGSWLVARWLARCPNAEFPKRAVSSVCVTCRWRRDRLTNQPTAPIIMLAFMLRFSRLTSSFRCRCCSLTTLARLQLFAFSTASSPVCTNSHVH